MEVIGMTSRCGAVDWNEPSFGAAFLVVVSGGIRSGKSMLLRALLLANKIVENSCSCSIFTPFARLAFDSGMSAAKRKGFESPILHFCIKHEGPAGYGRLGLLFLGVQFAGGGATGEQVASLHQTNAF